MTFAIMAILVVAAVGFGAAWFIWPGQSDPEDWL